MSSEQPQLLYPAATGSEGIVQAQFDKWSGVAMQAYQLAEQLASDIGNVPITTVAFNASFDPQAALPGFTAPTPPTVPTDELAFNQPPAVAAPPTVDLGNYTGSDAPTFDQTAPTLVIPVSPNVIQPAPVGTAPVLTIPELPLAPDITLPAVPTLEQLDLPAVPDISLPTFTGIAPVFDIPVPDENFSFTPAQYVDALLDQTKAAISAQMAGQPLPAATAQAIRDRAYSEAYAEELRTVETAYDEIAARGFCEPNGMLNRRVTQARDAGRKTRAGINRDIYIQDEQVAIENMRAAIAAGIQMEGQLISLYNSQTNLEFQAARYALDVSVSIFNARIGAFNAQVQLFTANAQVYRDQISGALAIVQIYQAEVEAQRAVGEINQQTVQLYVAQLQSVNTMVDIYRAQLSGAQTISQINTANVEAFSAQVQAYSAQINAGAVQWNAYKTQIDAQLGKAQFYNVSAEAYGETVRAWQAGEQTKQEAVKLQLSQGQLSLDQWRAKLNLFEEQLKTELGRIQTVAQTFSSEAELYRSEAQVATAAGDYDNRRFQLYLSQEQAIVDTELKRADASFQQVQYITSVMLEIKKTLATVSAQLASSAMSAVNIGASLSSETSERVDYGLNISYSGQMDTDS